MTGPAQEYQSSINIFEGEIGEEEEAFEEHEEVEEDKEQ